MAKNFASIAFSPAAKELQEKLGSRRAYARLEKESYVDGLTESEIEFIGEGDSFYMASMGANGYPYVQHRGGPKGFLKVLNDKQLGFIDFSGNRQYVSVGNLTTNNKVALIMVDYPTRTRLKIYAKARIVELEDEPELLTRLNLDDYKARPERMMVLDIEAYDWNCPQHITPRYTVEEIEKAIAPQRQYIAQLEAEIKALKAAAQQ
ncbi:MAG: pyridoxamine 5'-phosphate oxidase family protein [Chitinophagaceae bacterium]